MRSGADPKEILKAHGLRRTEAREALLRTLIAARQPLSHKEILARMRRRVNRVTIYRALDAFVEIGMVHEALVTDRTRVFELGDHCGLRQCHPHFTCRRCGAVHCMMEAVIPLAQNLPPGYVIERQRVHIEGLCPVCAKHSRKKARRASGS